MTTEYDYRSDSIDINDLLPPNIRTDITKSTLTTGVNRFLTPEDTVSVYGSIGNVNSDQQIVEDTIHRQTYQLQPLITSEYNNEYYSNSFKDILTKLEQLGVDLNSQDDWLSCDQFNFAPPIDYDKFINYKDYFWTDDSEPDYLVLNNPLNRLDSKIFEAVLNNDDISDLLLEQKQANIYLNATDIHKKQWIVENHWRHKTELSNYEFAKIAEVPILEYYDTLEINEWTYTKHVWYYRKNESSEWVLSNSEPSVDELTLRYPILSLTNNSVVVSGWVDKINTITILNSHDNNGVFKVLSITKNNNKTSTIIVDHTFNEALLSTNDLYTNIEYNGTTDTIYGVVIPFTTTSLGDPWKGLFVHWKYSHSNEPVYVNHQPENKSQDEFLYVVPQYGLDITPYNGTNKSLYGYEGQSRIQFKLPFEYMVDTNDIQIYVNGVRNYVDFTESFYIDKLGRYNREKYNSGLYNLPRNPKTLLSNSIQFTRDFDVGTIITVKVGPSALSDVKLHGVYVKTDNGIEFLNLMKYRKQEQLKTKKNQYVNFDIYSAFCTSAYTANPIFRYKEDITSNINRHLDIKIGYTNKSFVFENLLFNGKLLCYKDYFPNEHIHTVWSKCTERYTPKKINVKKIESQIDSDWELPQPLLCNYNHKCNNDLTYSELYEHFLSIIHNQASDKPYIGGNRIYKTLSRATQTGGTIKEHNSNLDFMISLIHQNIINIHDLIDFSKKEYIQNLYTVRKNTINNLPKLLKTYKNIDNTAIYEKIIESIMYDFKSNSRLSDVYFDTTAFNNKEGFVNWIATLPILGLFPSYEPMFFIDGNIGKLRHHDGHFSNISITDLEIAQFTTLLDKHGIIVNSTTLPVPENGIIWYDGKNFRRCFSDYIQSSKPSGNKGQYWYDTSSNTFYEYTTKWEITTKSLWVEFNLVNTISQMLLHVEQSLYDISKNIQLKYNINSYINNKYVQFTNALKEYYVQFFSNNRDLFNSSVFDQTNAFTWNYLDFPKDSNVVIKQSPEKWGAHWYTIYEKQFNTAYPHLEPWKLQNYHVKPDKWDDCYKYDGEWLPEMWDNIKNGVIHENLYMPDSAPPTYNVIPVNTTGANQGSWLENCLLPPYINHPVLSANSLVEITGVLPASISNIVQFGYLSINEKLWKESDSYPYDFVKTMFRLQPMRFCFDTFGNNTISVNDLNIDVNTQRVPRYTDIVYHGTVKNNIPYKNNGINQIFVNYLRSSNNISGIQDFIELTTKWEAKLCYQTNTVLQQEDIHIKHPYFDITNLDYKVYLKKSYGVENKSLTSFKITLFNAPTFQLTSNNTKRPIEDNWTFRIDALLANKPITRYGVRRYWIKDINLINNTFTLHKKFTNIFGNTEYKNITAPWNEHNVRVNYNSDTFNSKTSYVAISHDNSFSLLHYDKLSGNYEPVKLYDEICVYFVGNVYELTNNELRRISNNGNVVITPNNKDIVVNSSTNTVYQYRTTSNIWFKITNIPVVYADNLKIYDNDIEVNQSLYEFTPNLKLKYSPTKLSLRYALPIDTFIDEMVDPFSMPVTAYENKTWYHTSIDRSDIITESAPLFIYSIQGVIDFIDGYAEYLRDQGFIINDFEYPYVTQNGITMGWKTDIESFITRVYKGLITRFNNANSVYDYIEINPFKYDIRINTPEGIISNVLVGPYKDITQHPSVFDQTGAPITSTENLKILRTDKMTYITYPESNVTKNARYIGGLQLYVDHFENVIQFNDYTSKNNMIFDSFLGLYANQFIMRFKKHYEISKRPNLSGSVILDDKMSHNIVNDIDTFNQMYNRNLGFELLGYTKQQYSDLLDNQSNYLFWKGMLQYKGTDKGLQALVNNANLKNVELDELWSYKLNDFGSIYKPSEYLIDVYMSDVNKGRLLYKIKDTVSNDLYTTTNDIKQFIDLPTADVARWHNHHNIEQFDFIQLKTFKTIHLLRDDIETLPYIILPGICNNAIISINTIVPQYITINSSSNSIIEVPWYVPNTGMITVYHKSKIVDYTFVDNTHIKLGKFGYGKLSIVYQTGLLQNNEHYQLLRNNIVKLLIPNNFSDITIDMQKYNYDELTFGLLSNNIVTPIIKFDPLFDIFNPAMEYNYLTPTDPANYYEMRWDNQNIDQTWIDNSNLAYLPYHDIINASNPNDSDDIALTKADLWSNTPDWSFVVCYKWTENDVPPADNINAYKILQKSTRSNIYEPFGEWYDELTQHQIEYACLYDISDSVQIVPKFTIDNVDNYAVLVNEKPYDYTYTYELNKISYFVLSGLQESDIIRIIRYADVPIESAFTVDENSLVQYQYTYNYNTVRQYSISGSTFTTKYYYWVKNENTRNPLATTDIEQMLLYHNLPHVALLDDKHLAIYHVGDIITNNDYKLIIVRDKNFSDDKSLYNFNTEWGTIRKNSLSKVPVKLWNKLIESMIGQTLDTKLPLPSYNLVLQDKTNNTKTRYGISTNQIMGDKTTIFNLVVDTLYDTNFTIDYGKDLFFERYTFDNNTNIIKTMKFIYSTFTTKEVNTLYFKVLNELIAHNTELDGIFKTSTAILDAQVDLHTL